MSPRDQRLLLALAAVSLAMALVQAATGTGGDALLAVPVLALFMPLLAGRYVGESGLRRLAARVRARRPRSAAASSGAPLRAALASACFERPIAFSLAERGPPAPLLAR